MKQEVITIKDCMPHENKPLSDRDWSKRNICAPGDFAFSDGSVVRCRWCYLDVADDSCSCCPWTETFWPCGRCGFCHLEGAPDSETLLPTRPLPNDEPPPPRSRR